MEKEKKKSGFATAGLVLGIIGICTSFIPIVNNLSFVLALIGILFCIVSLIKRASKVTAFIAMIVCIITIVVVLQIQMQLAKDLTEVVDSVNEDINNISGNNTEDILENYLDIVFKEFEVIDENYITNTKLNVKIGNKSSEQKSFSIQVEAVSLDGTRIDTDTIYANNLNPGQAQNFEIFTLVSSEKIDQLKNATFKVVEVSMY